MSGPQSYERAVVDELRDWPGVTHRLEMGGKHCRVYLSYRGLERFVVYPTSPSDSLRGPLNFLQNVRKELRALGASKMVRPPPAERPRKQTIPRETKAPAITDPRPDGFAALRDLHERIQAAQSQPQVTPRRGIFGFLSAFIAGGRT